MRPRLLLITAATAVACGSGSSGKPDAATSPPFDGSAPFDAAVFDAGPQVATGTPDLVNGIDILFVIDDSATMQEEQDELLAAFPTFISELTTADGQPSLHIAVASTSVDIKDIQEIACAEQAGDEGTFSAPPECFSDGGSFLVDLQDGTKNYNGTLAEAFTCIADVGTFGCGFEQPLRAARSALENPANADFLRDDAALAIIIISDEDDCSSIDDSMFDLSQTTLDDPLGPISSFRCFEFGVECDEDDPRAFGEKLGCSSRASSPYMPNVASYSDYLRSLKPYGRIAIGIISGPRSPVVVNLEYQSRGEEVIEVRALAKACASPGTSADPGIRLRSLLDEFPDSRTAAVDICGEISLGPIADAMVEAMRVDP